MSKPANLTHYASVFFTKFIINDPVLNIDPFVESYERYIILKFIQELQKMTAQEES